MTELETEKKTSSWKKRAAFWSAPMLLVGALSGAAYYEHENSYLQSEFFGALAERNHYELTANTDAPDVIAPKGPYNVRLGYTKFPELSERLEGKGYKLVSKASGLTVNVSDLWDKDWPDVTLLPLYDEKAQAGIDITDSRNDAIHNARYPLYVYDDYRGIPALMKKTLYYVENRERLAQTPASRNYAIEWDRTAHAAYQQALKYMGQPTDTSGGSTLATQLEKFRHSEGGRTNGFKDKAQQMFTSSARAYLDSKQSTTAQAQETSTDYINAVPLSGYRGFGEVIGFADGMALWFGTDMDEYSTLFYKPEMHLSSQEWQEKAQLYRQTIALVLSVRQPTDYLRKDRDALERRIDIYLPLLAKEGIITTRLAEEAAKVKLEWAEGLNPDYKNKELDKAAELVRINFLQELGLNSIHDLDRMDIEVESTVDYQATRIANSVLHQLGQPESEIGQRVLGERMAKAETADQILYSFTLYERGEDMNYLRVQTDNFDGDLNLNEDSLLELGSTAKFRTLITYLEYTLDAYRANQHLLAEELPSLSELQYEQDGITSFVYDYLQDQDNPRSEEAILAAAMQRIYSANTSKRFYTSGGPHSFANFMRRDHWREVSVREAFEDSINLPFIRMMEDVVQYVIYNEMQVSPAIYDASSDDLAIQDQRVEYLTKYMRDDAGKHLNKIMRRYQGHSADEMGAKIFTRIDTSYSAHIAALHRYLYPSAAYQEFSAFMHDHLSEDAYKVPSESDMQSLYQRYAEEKYDINDRAYILGLHPLEIWLAKQRIANPDVDYKTLHQQTADMAPEIYEWLLKSKNTRRKNRNIYTMLEQEAFEVIHQNWQDKGFPFGKLIPSYATSIGVSGDTPQALADLVGIILNNGKRLPNAKFTAITMGDNTPYERNLVYAPQSAEQVLDPQIAAIVKENLENIVANGTARRANDTFKPAPDAVGDNLPESASWVVGGKTGTGDNRIETFNRYGYAESSKVRNRTATFVFTFGDKYFGSIIAYAPGEGAAAQEFTSALPVQAFKEIMRKLTPSLEQQQHKGYDAVDKALQQGEVKAYDVSDAAPIKPLKLG